MTTFPHYLSTDITMLNPKGSIGIITFWSQLTEYPIETLKEFNYFAIGPLYSIDDFKYIILNSFLAPNLKHLLFAGLDRDHISDMIKDFFTSTSSELYTLMSQSLLEILDFSDNPMKLTPKNIIEHILTIFRLRYRQSFTIISSVELITRYHYISNVLTLSRGDIVPHLYKCKQSMSTDTADI